MTITSEKLRDAFKYLYPAELPELKRIASMLPANPVIINIGAGAGTSGLAFLEARNDAQVWTIDKENEPSPLGSLASERGVVDRAGLSHLSGIRWFQIHGDSPRIGLEWQFGKVDMVFIDGDHSYEGCRADIEAWLPRVRDFGFISVHDYRKSDLAPDPNGPHPMPWPGVDQAVDELLLPRFELVSRVDSLITFITGNRE
jgi:predicted O-methyltransferase YrrM